MTVSTISLSLGTLWPAGDGRRDMYVCVCDRGRRRRVGGVGGEIDIGRFRGLFVPLPLSESQESWSA